MKAAARARRAALAAALSAVGAACAPIDDIGELDVLSRPPPAMVSTSDAGAANDAAPDVAEMVADVAPRFDVVEPPREASTTCKMLSDQCTYCMSISRCVLEWGACFADTQCLLALRTVRNCNCDAQTSDAGSLTLCQQAFQAVGMPSTDLATCIVASCAADCGI